VLEEWEPAPIQVAKAHNSWPRASTQGYLVPENYDMEIFSENLAEAVIKSIKEDWKTKMSDQCQIVAAPFSN